MQPKRHLLVDKFESFVAQIVPEPLPQCIVREVGKVETLGQREIFKVRPYPIIWSTKILDKAKTKIRIKSSGKSDHELYLKYLVQLIFLVFAVEKRLHEHELTENAPNRPHVDRSGIFLKIEIIRIARKKP